MQKLTCASPCLRDASDSILVQQVLGGNHDAFAILMDRYHSLLYRFVYHYLGEYDQACDVVQHVFLQLYLSLPILLRNVSLKGWLFQVARNRCLDELRKRRRRAEILFSTLEWKSREEDLSPVEAIPDPEPLPEERAERIDLQGSLQQALFALPPKVRSIVHLRCFKDLSFAEIARRLHMPEPTVKTYYYRSLPHLRTALANSEHVAAIS